MEQNYRPPWMDFFTPHFAMGLLIIGLFAWAFGENTGDDTMKGALIGAFNLAIGYWLGSASSTAKQREQTGQALGLAASAAERSEEPQDVVVMNKKTNPVPTQDSPARGK